MNYCYRLITAALFVINASTLLAKNFANKNELDCIKTNIIHLKTITACNNFDDLKTLKSILKNVRVIALGEATHGTREFFQCKHRMLEFFVREMGCRYLLIEASYINCLAVNEYILYGKGDRDTVLSGVGFWCWNTQEVAEMLDWMHKYNQTAPANEKVQFFGFDCQMNEKAEEIICSLIQKGDPSYYEKAKTFLSPLKTQHAFFHANESQLIQIKENIQAASDHLDSHANTWKSSFKDYEYTHFLLRLLKQECEIMLCHKRPFSSIEQFIETQHPELKQIFVDQEPEIFFTDEMLLKYPDLEKVIPAFFEDQSMRDFYMAENITTILESISPTARVMIWAHNEHVALDMCDGIHAMGSYLKKKLGSTYYAIGFATSLGTFQALDITKDKCELSTFSIPLQPEDSWAFFFGKLEESNFFLDFRSAPINQWLSTPHLMLSLGNCFSTKWLPESYLAKQIPLEHFDGLIYLHQTTAAHPVKR